MAVDIIVPTLGESVSEATVAKWLKNVGDAVGVDEPLVELETDKVSLEVPSPSAGTLSKIIAINGAEVAVGSVLGNLDEGAAELTPTAEPSAGEGQNAADKPQSRAPELSPAVRKLVEENRIDPQQITATGAKGNITKGDVLEFLNTQDSGTPSVVPAETNKHITPPLSSHDSADLPPRPADERGDAREHGRAHFC